MLWGCPHPCSAVMNQEPNVWATPARGHAPAAVSQQPKEGCDHLLCCTAPFERPFERV